MPKAEKELRKDLNPIQQDIKRKVSSPGTPSEVGLWDGASDTKYRNGCNRPPKFALTFLLGSCFDSSHNRWQYPHENLIISALLSFLLTKSPLLEILVFTEEMLKNVNAVIQDSLNLTDSCEVQLNP